MSIATACAAKASKKAAQIFSDEQHLFLMLDHHGDTEHCSFTNCSPKITGIMFIKPLCQSLYKNFNQFSNSLPKL